MPQYEVSVPGKGTFSVNSPTDLTDQQVWAAVQQQLSVPEPIPPAPPPERGLASIAFDALKRGGYQTGMLLGDVLPAMVGRAIGADEYADRQLAEAAETQKMIQRELPQAVASYTDISGVGDAVKYVVEAVGENLVSILPSIFTGGAATILTAGARTAAIKAAEKKAVEEVTKAAAKNVLTQETLDGIGKAALDVGIKEAQKIAAKAQIGGAFAGSALQNIPEVYQNVLEETGKESLGAALLFGGLNSALDTVTPALLLRKISKAGLSTDEIGKAWYKRFGKGLAEGFVSEGATETAQEMSSAAAEKFIDENKEFFTQKNLERFINAGLKGGLGGGIITGATDVATGKGPEAPQKKSDENEIYRRQQELLGLVAEDKLTSQQEAEEEAKRQKALAEQFKPLAQNDLLDMAPANLYLYIESLKQRPATAEVRAEIKSASEILAAKEREEIQRRQSPTELTQKILGDYKIPRNSNLYNELVGKNLGSSEDIVAVRETLNTYKGMIENDQAPKALLPKIDRMLADLDRFEANLPYGRGAYVEPTVQPAIGEGAPVAEQPATGTAPAGTGVTEPSGVVPPVSPVGEPPVGEGAVPAPVATPKPAQAPTPKIEAPVQAPAPVAPAPVAAPAPIVAAPTPLVALPSRLQNITPAERSLYNLDQSLVEAQVPIKGFDFERISDAPSADGRGMTPEGLVLSLNKAVDGVKDLNGKLRSGNRTGATLSQLIEQWKTASQIQARINQSKQDSPKIWENYAARQKELESLKVGDLVQTESGELARLDAKFPKNWRIVFDEPVPGRLAGEKTLRSKETLRPAPAAPVAEAPAATAAIPEKPVAPEVHVDQGKTEPATPAVIADAASTGQENTSLTLPQMKANLLGQIDEAINSAPDVEDKDSGFVNFDVPGDGKFKVLNNKNRLAEFRKKIEYNPGFRKTNRPSPTGAEETVRKGSSSKEAAIRAMIDEGDPQAAVDYAAILGLDIKEILKKDKRLPLVSDLTPTPPEEAPKAEKKPAKPSLKEEEAVEETEQKTEEEKAPSKEERRAVIEQKMAELEALLKKSLSKFGLKDVEFKLSTDLQASGLYAENLITLALDASNPLQDLRHEAIHALKELGFFSDSQWNALVREAKGKWINKFLKERNINKGLLEEDQKSRYDAYIEYYTKQGLSEAEIEQVIIEEAIADAFAEFDSTKPPPGLMQAILTRLRNFFSGVKDAANEAGFTEAEQIFGRVERGELAPGQVEKEKTAKPSLRAPETEAFKRWFGESKIVDEGGRPVPVYHATRAPKTGELFSQFRLSDDGKLGEGIYASSIPEYAEGYSIRGPLMPLWASIENPFVINIDSKFIEYETAPFGETEIPGGRKYPYISSEKPIKEQIEQFVREQTRGKRRAADLMGDSLRDLFEKAGHDGVVVKDDEGNFLEVNAFKPTQIKSATGNIGTYDITKPDIRASLRDATEDDRRRSLNDKRVSPRLPTAVKATEDPLGKVRLQPDLETFKRDPAAFRHNIGLMSKYPNFANVKGTPDQRAEQMIEHMKENLLWLFNQWDKKLRDRSKLWYVGGNRIAHRWAEKYSIPPEQAAAIIAALSPQKDWFQNVSLAERTLDALVFNADTAWTPEMTKVFRERAWAKKFPLRKFRDKTLKEMYIPGDAKSLVNMAAWIRAWDEATNPQTARVITPEGNFSEEVASGKTGKPIAMRAQSFAAMVKTLQMMQQTDLGVISDLIGKNHKVRSFYNNIIAPYAGDDVTIDTHAVAAALMRPLGSSDLEVYHNFGSAKPAKKDKEGNILIPASPGTKNSAITGLYGTYAMYAEAYRRAAQEAKVLPREMQSITWEAIRGLFRPEQKQAKLKQQTNVLWNKVSKGEVSGKNAREQISEMVSGITDPAWAKSPAGVDESRTDSSYATELPRTGVSGGRPAEPAGRTGKRVAGAVPRASLRDAIGLYSELENKIAQGPNAAPAPQWKAYIKGLVQKGVKPEEIEWSGVNDWLDLQTGRVSKEALNDYLKQGGVRVEETVLGGRAPWRERLDLLENRGVSNLNADEKEELSNLRDRFDQEGPTPEPESAQAKYNHPDLVLPGGENYREVLLTLPPRPMSFEETNAHLREVGFPPMNREQYEKRVREGGIGDGGKGPQYRSSHWDQPNVLAHIRLNDRTDADGNKVLFVEEIQSDWGREGKKKGFKGKTQEDAKRFFGITDEDWSKASEMDREAYRNEMLDYKGRDIIPAAPFVTKTEGWLNLALKRIMVMAAEGGYDKVAFVNGEQSADRFSLDKKVDELHWRTSNGSRRATLDMNSGDSLTFNLDESGVVKSAEGTGETRYVGKGFDEIVGKELAEKVLSEPRGILSGNGLKVGGEGMKTFYDTIVPTALKKLLPKVGGGQMGSVSIESTKGDAETQKWFGRIAPGAARVIQRAPSVFQVLVKNEKGVEQVRGGNFNTQAAAEQYIADNTAGLTQEQLGFDITPDMKQKVQTTGLPRFSLRDVEGVPTIGPKMDGTFLRRMENIRQQIGDAYISGEIDFEEFQKRYAATNEEYVNALFVQKKIDEAKPAAGLEEVFPGFVSIPNGTKILATSGLSYPEPTEATVVGSTEIRVGEKAYKFPVVDFGDGRERRLGYGDVKEVFAPRPVKASLRSTTNPAALARISQVTTTREEKTFVKRITDAIAPTARSKFRAAFINRYNRLSEYDKVRAEKMGGVALMADSSAESAALMSDLAAGVTASVLGVHNRKGGIPVYSKGFTTVLDTVEGPLSIFAPLAKYGDPLIYQKYQYWSAVKRGLRLYREGREENITPADKRLADEILRDHPEFADIQKKWIKFNDGLVKYLVDTGVLSKEKAAEFTKYSDYIPFYRQIDGDENAIGPKIFQSISGVKAPKKLKGSEAPLGDFLETIVRNVQSSVQAGMKNVAAQRAAKVAMDIGMAARLNHVASGLDVFKVLENGKEVYYRSADPLFIDAIKSLNLGEVPFIGFLSGPANLLRNLVTKDPGFMLANMMRDSMAAWVTSGVKMTPIISTAGNFAKAIAGTSPEMQALLNAGILGGYEYSQGVKVSASKFGKELRKTAGKMTAAEMAARPATYLWEALEKGTLASDAATRMEIYKKTLAETGNEAEALYKAMEVMNFNRKGSSAVVRILTAAVPFLNARIQGLDVLYRAAFGEMATADAQKIQKAFFVRGMTIAALSCLYWALTHDDKEYKKQEQETRDNFWLIPSLGVRIPIPFEVGVIFKVIPERIMGVAFGDDTGRDFLKSMGRQLTSTLAFNPIPQSVLPLVESTANFSFFTMRPIIDQGMENIAPFAQVSPRTSKLSELAGKALKDLPTEFQISPMKLDQLINGYTGTLGMYMVDAFDAIYNMHTDSPKPSKRFEQLPIIKRFALDPEARGQVTAYYELKNKVDEVVRTSNLLERTMDYKGWGEYYKDNIKLLAVKDYILDMEKTMKELREMKNLVRVSSMSADAKRDAILGITKMENALNANTQHLKKSLAR